MTQQQAAHSRVGRLSADSSFRLACVLFASFLKGGNSLHTSPARSLFTAANTFVSVGGGDHFSVAIDEEGALASWGKGAAGCLGHGNTNSLIEPLFVAGFGASPERAGVGKDPSKYLGRVVQLKPGHNHCAVFARK